MMMARFVGRALPVGFWLLLVCARSASAQVRDTLPLSMNDAVAAALARGDEALIAQAQIELAEAQVTIARAAGLPQLRLNGTYNHVFENARAQAVGSIFNQPNTYNINGNLSQAIFQGGRIFAGARAASRVRRAARLTAEEVRAEVSFNVQRAYLQALFTDRMVQIQEASFARAGSQLKQVEQFEAGGRAARYDVLRARVQQANLEPLVIESQNSREAAILELKRLANIAFEQPIRLTTSLQSEGVQAVVDRVEAVAPVRAERPSLVAARLLAEARREGVKIAYADLLPTVSIFIQSGYQAFPLNNSFPTSLGRLDPVTCPEGTPAGRVCTQQNGGFFSDRSLGVQVSWPIFDGLRAKGNIDAAKAQARLAHLQYVQERESVDLEVATARANFERARALFAARRSNSGEAAEAFRLASLRYSRGLSTQLDVSDTQLAMQTAEVNEARATYDLYLAAAELARALGQPMPLPGDVARSTSAPSGAGN